MRRPCAMTLQPERPGTGQSVPKREPAHAVVVDNNVLRSVSTIERLAAAQIAGGPAIAVPEIALFEMTKNAEHWELTLRRSLQAVARFPNAVVLTTAMKSLGVAEQRRGEPTVSILSPRTEVFRCVLRDLAAGSGPRLDEFFASVRETRGALAHDAHALDSLTTMRRLDDIAAPVTDRNRRAEISRDLARGDRSSFREFAEEALPRSAYQPSLAKITSPQIAETLWRAPTVTAMHAVAMGLLALEWVLRGGVHTAKAKRAANDVLDWEYAISAFWSEGFCCCDEGAWERFEDMRVLGRSIWPEFTSWFDGPTRVPT